MEQSWPPFANAAQDRVDDFVKDRGIVVDIAITQLICFDHSEKTRLRNDLCIEWR